MHVCISLVVILNTSVTFQVVQKPLKLCNHKHLCLVIVSYPRIKVMVYFNTFKCIKQWTMCIMDK